MNLERVKSNDKKGTFQKKPSQYELKKDNQRNIELCLLGAVEIIGNLYNYSESEM